jgi:hypothetical protein
MSAPKLVYVRPTDNVDIVVETATYAKYNKMLEDLRKLGFAHDMDGPTGFLHFLSLCDRFRTFVLKQ